MYLEKIDKSLSPPWKCPKCNLELFRSENKNWQCLSGHYFDTAKEGYVNLILANQKSSLQSGDTKEMLLARERFLETGAYDEIWKRIVKCIEIEEKTPRIIAEIGCGTAYYLAEICRKLQPEGGIGTDISKEAVKIAAKKNPNLNFAVSNSYNLAILDQSCDLVISIFSPFEPSEVERILGRDGIFICVRPGPGHWREIKEKFNLEIKESNKLHFPTLKLQRTESISGVLAVNPAQIKDLIEMSPLKWQIFEEKKASLELGELTIEFELEIYCRLI